jgi:hypothetical protein
LREKEEAQRKTGNKVMDSYGALNIHENKIGKLILEEQI